MSFIAFVDKKLLSFIAQLLLFLRQTLITFICSCVGTYHACNLVISGTATIGLCSDDCRICKEEVNKREYYNCRCQGNEGS